MIWDAAGAEAVAAVRAWLKSERWEQALALWGVRTRHYRRKQVDQAVETSEVKRQDAKQQASEPVEPVRKARRTVTAEVLSQVQAELAEQHGKNGWGKVWSVARQRELAAQREQLGPRLVA